MHWHVHAKQSYSESNTQAQLGWFSRCPQQSKRLLKTWFVFRLPSAVTCSRKHMHHYFCNSWWPKKVHEVEFEQIHDIARAINISDDIIVFGKTSWPSLALSPTTICRYWSPQFQFFGLVFLANGVSLDPAKVRTIHNAPPSMSVSEVWSYLGIVIYCTKFIPSFSGVIKPLRDLTRKDSRFRWKDEHNQALQKVKELLTSDTVMAYNKQSELLTDASPFGL